MSRVIYVNGHHVTELIQSDNLASSDTNIDVRGVLSNRMCNLPNVMGIMFDHSPTIWTHLPAGDGIGNVAQSVYMTNVKFGQTEVGPFSMDAWATGVATSRDAGIVLVPFGTLLESGESAPVRSPGPPIMGSSAVMHLIGTTGDTTLKCFVDHSDSQTGPFENIIAFDLLRPYWHAQMKSSIVIPKNWIKARWELTSPSRSDLVARFHLSYYRR